MQVVNNGKVFCENLDLDEVTHLVITDIIQKFDLTKDEERCISVHEDKIEYKDGYLHDVYTFIF
jgi:hypothetical protein